MHQPVQINVFILKLEEFDESITTAQFEEELNDLKESIDPSTSNDRGLFHIMALNGEQ